MGSASPPCGKDIDYLTGLALPSGYGLIFSNFFPDAKTRLCF